MLKKMEIKNKNIVLIGLMGSGKSSTGLVLAKLLKRKIYSTDELIEKKEGQTIVQIFECQGEAYFRQLEQMMVKKICAKKGVVIDCGGGVFINKENRDTLKENGLVIYLSADVQSLYDRVKIRTHRPLLKVEDPLKKLKDLLKERQKFYQEADLKIKTDGKTPQEVAEEILKVLNS